MKVAYVHTVPWPSRSPAVTFVGLAAAGLAEAGAEVHLFVRRGVDECSPQEVFRKEFGREPPPGLTFHVMSGSLVLSLATNQFFYRRVLRALTALLNQGKIDVVISRSCTFLPFLAHIRERYGIQTWFESHDFYADLNRRDDLKNERRRWERYEKLERRWLPRITGLICLQESQARLYREVFPTLRIVLARTGLDMNESHAVPNLKGRTSLTYIGSLDSHKGVEFLLQGLAASRCRPRLTIVGGKTTEEIARIREEARLYGIEDLVSVEPWCDKTALGQVLQTTRAGAVPLLNTFFNRYLTSPLKIFEYYRSGVPVIAADLPTVRELVREPETGLLFAPGDPHSLGNAIDHLWQCDDEAYRHMVECVFQLADTFRWVRRSESLLAEFTRAIPETHL